MIFRKKIVEVEIDPEEQELINELDWIKRRYESLLSDLHQQKIDDVRFLREEGIISDELKELERKKNLDTFDDMMGHPLEWMHELFDEK